MSHKISLDNNKCLKDYGSSSEEYYSNSYSSEEYSGYNFELDEDSYGADNGRRRKLSKIKFHQQLILKKSFFSKFNYNELDLEPVIDLQFIIKYDVFRRIYISQIIHENIIRLIGFIHRAAYGTSSYYVRVALTILHEELKRNHREWPTVLSVLPTLDKTNKTAEILQIISTLQFELMPYSLCAVDYVRNAFEDGTINTTALLTKYSEYSNGMLLDGLTNDDIKLAGQLSLSDGALPHDKSPSYIHYNKDDASVTYYQMGSIYVKIFDDLNLRHNQIQHVFIGLFIKELHNIYNCPVYAEYRNYLSQWIFRGQIPDWNEINLLYGNSVTMMTTFTYSLCDSKKISLEIKKASLYMLHQVMRSATNAPKDIIYDARNVADDNTFDITLLFGLEFYTRKDNYLTSLKINLLNYLIKNINGSVHESFKEFDQYAYLTTTELSMAMLAHMQLRLPAQELNIIMTISALLAHKMLLTYYRELTYPKPSLITILFIIDAIYQPTMNITIIEMMRKVEEEFINFIRPKNAYQPVDLFDYTRLMPTRMECLCPQYCANIMLKRLLSFGVNEKFPKTLLAGITYLHKYLVKINEINNDFKIVKRIQPPSLVVLKTIKSQPKPSVRLRQKPTMKKPKKKINSPTTTSTMRKNFKNLKPTKKNLLNNGIQRRSNDKNQNLNIDKFDYRESAKLPSISSVLRNASMLPPEIQSEGCIVINSNFDETNNFPIVTTNPKPDSFSIILPSMAELQEQPNNYYILEHVNPQCTNWIKAKIIKPITIIYGKNFMTKLLHKNWSIKYPTRISALISLLLAAVSTRQNERKSIQPDVMLTIKKTIEILRLICPYLFLPMISRWRKLDVEVIWSTINTRQPTLIKIDDEPPMHNEAEADTVSLPLINPVYWLLPVDTVSDPLPSMMPKLPSNSEHMRKLQPLIETFKLKEINLLIGEQIDISKFPNRGALFIWALHRLNRAKQVKSNAKLSKLIKLYLQAIQRPAMYLKIPMQFVVGNIAKGQSKTVDLVRLMNALPQPRSEPERKMWKILQAFFSRINLLEELGIILPPRQTKCGDFLKLVIKTALTTSNIVIDQKTIDALRYYQDKIIYNGVGAANVVWIRFRKIIMESKMYVGKMIETVLPYDSLSRDNQKAYNCFIGYVNRHSELLNIKPDFPIEKFKTVGTFIKGFLQYILKSLKAESTVKACIKKLIPHIIHVGAGAKKMPSRRSLLRTTSKLSYDDKQ